MRRKRRRKGPSPGCGGIRPEHLSHCPGPTARSPGWAGCGAGGGNQSKTKQGTISWWVTYVKTDSQLEQIGYIPKRCKEKTRYKLFFFLKLDVQQHFCSLWWGESVIDVLPFPTTLNQLKLYIYSVLVYHLHVLYVLLIILLGTPLFTSTNPVFFKTWFDKMLEMLPIVCGSCWLDIFQPHAHAFNPLKVLF